eukprot:6213747-Pleurochrysis_carterae.AAC.4
MHSLAGLQSDLVDCAPPRPKSFNLPFLYLQLRKRAGGFRSHSSGHRPRSSKPKSSGCRARRPSMRSWLLTVVIIHAVSGQRFEGRSHST